MHELVFLSASANIVSMLTSLITDSFRQQGMFPNWVHFKHSQAQTHTHRHRNMHADTPD